MIIDHCFQKTKLNELNNWKTNHVYEEIPYNNQILIHVKWMCIMKETNYQNLDFPLKVLRNQQKMKY